jgi:hypothetical protein
MARSLVTQLTSGRCQLRPKAGEPRKRSVFDAFLQGLSR